MKNNNLNVRGYIEQIKQPRTCIRTLNNEGAYSFSMFYYAGNQKIHDLFEELGKPFLENADSFDKAREWLDDLRINKEGIYSRYFNEDFYNEEEYNDFIKRKLEDNELSIVNLVKYESIDYIFKVLDNNDNELLYYRDDATFLFDDMEKALERRIEELKGELDELEEELNDYENIIEELDEEEVQTIEDLALFIYNQPRYLELKEGYFFPILWLAQYEHGFNDEHTALHELLADTETLKKLALKSKLEQQLEQLNTTQKKGVKI